MTYLNNWEEFEKAAEKLYLANPSKCRVLTKYRHIDGILVLKVTDGSVVLKYKTELAQDVKKIEKLNSLLMRHMASKV